MMRNLLGIRLGDKISCEEIYKRVNIKKVGVIAKVLKFRYAGHTVRDKSHKWNNILTP